MTTPRLRQSYAKALLAGCPLLVKRELDAEKRQPTRAMQRGSLLDHLVFGHTDRYEVVDALYVSGPREGQQAEDYTSRGAREQQRDILERGLTPALQCEIDEMEPTVEAIQAKIGEVAGLYGRDPVLHFQPEMTWRTPLGVAARGTPDVVVVLPDVNGLVPFLTIDVKHTAAIEPKKFDSQVYAMGWDIQAAAYKEGAGWWVEETIDHDRVASLGHVIIATSPLDGGLPPVAITLSGAWLEIGLRRWEKAQKLWQRCLDTGEWPSYPDRESLPPLFVTRAELEAYDETQFEEEP